MKNLRFFIDNGLTLWLCKSKIYKAIKIEITSDVLNKFFRIYLERRRRNYYVDYKEKLVFLYNKN